MNISKRTQVLIAALIIVVASAYPIYWLIQNQINPTPSESLIFRGNQEIGKDYIRFWTDPQADSWSGMRTVQEWSFAHNPRLKAQVQVNNLGGPTLYNEIILVNERELDEGFGFQLTYASPDKVQIRGWSWAEDDEPSESFTDYTDKNLHTTIYLEATKVSVNQIDYYVDGTLLGSITGNILFQQGILNIDLTNGSQGGLAEITFSYQVEETA